MMLRAVWIVVILSCAPPGGLAEVKPVDLCELFRDPIRWNGQIVRTSGPVEVGFGKFGSWLSGKRCAEHIEVHGIEFANLIALEDHESGTQQLAGFARDEGSIERFRHSIETLDGAKDQLRVAVIGLFQTRDPVSALVQDRPEPRPLGFGDHNAAPFAIVIQQIAQIAVEPLAPVDHYYVQASYFTRRSQRMLWVRIKAALTEVGGNKYFDSDMRDTWVPGGQQGLRTLTGILRDCDPVQKVLAVAMLDPSTPDATLKLRGASPEFTCSQARLSKGSRIEFEGIAKTYSADPFNITFEVPVDRLVVTKNE